MTGYLTLTRTLRNPYVIGYRLDSEGSPILNPADVMIIRVRPSENVKMKLMLNGDSYKFARYEILKGELKNVVDKKLSELESKLRRAEHE